MNDRRFTRSTLAAGAALALFFLTGCGAAGGDADENPAPSASASESGAPVASEPTTAFEPDDPACLYGTWTLDQAGLVAYFDQINELMAAQGAMVEFAPEGSAQLVMDDAGAFNWMPSTVTRANIADQEMIVTLGGTLAGTFTASPGVITTDAEVDNQLQLSATVGGVEIDPAAVAAQISAAPISDSAFVCTDNTLELTTSVTGASVTTTLYR